MKRWWYFALSACLALAGLELCRKSLHLSQNSFAGYDPSPMIDAGWRVLSGQVPGRDFIVTFPPSLYLLVAVGFHYLGVTWHSLALLACIVYGSMVLLGLRLGALLNKIWGFRVAATIILIYFIGQSVLLISINYPWHSSMAQSFVLYCTIATCAMLYRSKRTRPERIEVVGHLCLAWALLWISKPNLAVPAIMLSFFLLARAGVKIRRLFFICLVSLAIDTAILARAHTNLLRMFQSYAGLTGRVVPRGFLLPAGDSRFGVASLLIYVTLMPLAITFAMILWTERHRLQPIMWLAIGTCCISLIGMGTNFDFKLTDSPTFLLGVALLCATDQSLFSRALQFRLACTALAIFGISLYFGKSRIRMRTNSNSCPTQVRIDDRFLGTILDCENLAFSLTQIDNVLDKNPDERVFFGPGLEFLYAGRRLSAPLHLPDWWDIGSSFPVNRLGQVADAWKQDRFDLLVFQNRQSMLYLPEPILKTISAEYVKVSESSDSLIFEHAVPTGEPDRASH